ELQGEEVAGPVLDGQLPARSGGYIMRAVPVVDEGGELRCDALGGVARQRVLDDVGRPRVVGDPGRVNAAMRKPELAAVGEAHGVVAGDVRHVGDRDLVAKRLADEL